jgi:hypothetical protein
LAETVLETCQSIRMNRQCGRSVCESDGMKIPPDGFGCFWGDYGSERLGGSLLYVAEAAEVSEKALSCLRADAGNVQ